MEAGRNDIGGRIGLTQGRRASPIVRASSPGQPGDDVSHSPTRLPMPDNVRPTVTSTSMLDPGLTALNLSDYDSNQNDNLHPLSSPMTSKILQSSNMLHEIRVPLSRDHGPHGRATVPVLGVTTTRGQGQGYNIDLLTPRGV